jgi:hypothetical protein
MDMDLTLEWAKKWYDWIGLSLEMVHQLFVNTYVNFPLVFYRISKFLAA